MLRTETEMRILGGFFVFANCLFLALAFNTKGILKIDQKNSKSFHCAFDTKINLLNATHSR